MAGDSVNIRGVLTPLLKELKSWAGGKTDKERELKSLPMEGMKECRYWLTLALGR